GRGGTASISDGRRARSETGFAGDAEGSGAGRKGSGADIDGAGGADGAAGIEHGKRSAFVRQRHSRAWLIERRRTGGRYVCEAGGDVAGETGCGVENFRGRLGC